MNRARFAVVLISIFSGMSCTVAGGADVPDKVQLIGLPPTNLPVATEWSGLIQWPPLETIQSCVVTDRVFFSTNVLNEQSVLEDPARQPVLRAKLEACDWVCNVLRSEWCQGYDWAKGNSWAVRMGSPIRSMMMDRYEIGGTAIQAMQSRSRMCIVIRPSAELTKGMESKDLPKFVLRTFFTRGGGHGPVAEQRGET